ncbi:hypothetical protein C7271_22390 [filamentous cyanobacterium CCP5]|nr:hypothetical protein C7271_22390 [filamentous cyanobacterium CCP5]
MDDVISTTIATCDLNPIDRWNVFNRLQELAIPCRCATGRPLQVILATPTEALLVWSVVRSWTQSRAELAAHLEGCWQQQVQR